MGCGSSSSVENYASAAIDSEILRDVETNEMTQKVLLLGAGIIKILNKIIVLYCINWLKFFNTFSWRKIKSAYKQLIFYNVLI